MGHKHTKSQTRIQKDIANTERNKQNRKARWVKLRKKWSEDKEYQQKQTERLKMLQSKSGYQKNIEEGKKLKEEAKKQKAIKRAEQLKKKKRRLQGKILHQPFGFDKGILKSEL